MREKSTYNRYYEKFSEFSKILLAFFENIENYCEILKSRIIDNFQHLTFT